MVICATILRTPRSSAMRKASSVRARPRPWPRLRLADDDAVFNGSCGAESGWVPVSAVAPSVLVKEIEIEKKAKFVPLPQDDVFKNRARLRKATVITPPNVIKSKVGDGGIDPADLKNAQDYVAGNTVDFIPIGKALVEALHVIIGQIKTGKLRGEGAIEAMLFPAAQLKAQGALFRYSLVSEIAEILVDFLERVEKADKDVIDVVDAHVVAVTFILSNSMKDDGRGLDRELKNSLLKACSRYYALKEK